MSGHLDDTFIQHLNQHLGIAHKVVRMYFQDTEEREDVLQEMMYQLWRSYPGFDGRSKFSTWMYSVCLHTALTYSRKNKRVRYEPLSPAHQQITDPEPGSQEDATALLFAAIATLSPVNKAIVLLYLESLSYDEIASVMGLTRANVSVRLVRIKKELETLLKPKIKSTDNVRS